MKDYKIETRGSLWHVILSRGCYSDYEEKHLCFSANSEDEVWRMIEIYVKDNYKEYQRSFILKDVIFKYVDKYFILQKPKKSTLENHNKNARTMEDFDSSCYDFDVCIKRLEIIIFDKI